jgi:hypothetical protein
MSNTIYVASLNPGCAANTPASTPGTLNLGIPRTFLVSMEVLIPRGHQGLTGIALVDSSQFIVPYAATGQAWFTGDGTQLKYGYGKELGAHVNLSYYNTDNTYQHGWQVWLAYIYMSDYDPDEGVDLVSTAGVDYVASQYQ